MEISIADSINDKPSVIKFTGQYFKNSNNEYEKLFVHQYYKNGKLHRDNAPARVYTNGNEVWYYHGKIHRDNAPAIINKIPLDFIDNVDLVDDEELPLKCLYQVWYNNGVFHRLGGPAVESIHLYSKTKECVYTEYYINGVEYTEHEYNKIMENVNKFIRQLKQKVIINKIINVIKMPVNEDIVFEIADFF
jgi:hypothetical protein